MITGQITKEQFDEVRNDGGRHRICFATTHSSQPKRIDGQAYVGSFSLPFRASIGRVFEADCGLGLFPSKVEPAGCWRSVRSEDEFTTIETWVKRQGTRVFIRDCLDISLALGVNIEENEAGSRSHTTLGKIEHLAKTARDETAIAELTDRLCETIGDVSQLASSGLIAAVPPRPGKDFDLPSVLAQRIAMRLSLQDLTAGFRFARAKNAIKETSLDQKWTSLEASGLSFSPRFAGACAVVLIDDKYQSGTTINYVGSVLQSAGAGAIYGLCAVKTMRDTDNA